MATLDLEHLLPCLNVVKSVLSSEGDALTIHVKDSQVLFYNYDRSKEFQIFGRFDRAVNGGGDFKFTISLDMLRTLLKGRRRIDVELTKEGLVCKSKSFSATVEYSKAEAFEYPEIADQNFEIDKSIYAWIKSVKLNTLFRKEDMFVFIKYFAEERVLRVACADNYHTSMLTVKRKAPLKIDAVLPVRYIEYANKLIESDAAARLVVDGDNTYFCNPHLILKTPTVMVSEDTSFAAIVSHNDAMRDTKNRTTFTGIGDVKRFIKQAAGIREEDRDNQIHIRVREDRIRFFVETKRGSVSFKKQATSNYTDDALINTKALSDIIDRIPDDAEIDLRLNSGNLYLSYTIAGLVYESTIIGTANED